MKKLMFKRLLAGFLPAVMLFTSAGCGKKGQNAEKSVMSESLGSAENAETGEENEESLGNSSEESLEESQGEYHAFQNGEWIAPEDDYASDSRVKQYLEEGFSLDEAIYMCASADLFESVENFDNITISFGNDAEYYSIEKDGNNLVEFSVKSSDGRVLRFGAENIEMNADGNLVFNEESRLYSLSSIPGIARILVSGPSVTTGMWIYDYTGMNLAEKEEVNSKDEIAYSAGYVTEIVEKSGCYVAELNTIDTLDYFKLEKDGEDSGEFIISEINIAYTGKRIGVARTYLDTDFYGYLLEGGYYDASKERWSSEEQIFTFYLVIEEDSVFGRHRLADEGRICGVEQFTVGDLVDQNGNVKDKSEKLEIGDQLIVSCAGADVLVDLPIMKRMEPMLIRDALPASTAPSTGDLNVLVVPFYYQDQEGYLEESLEQIINCLGNVKLSDGSLKEGEISGEYATLSEYYEKASYGQLHLTSYVTDWYCMPEGTFEDYRWSELNKRDIDLIQEWVQEQYASWTSDLDQDQNGIYDAVVLVCAADLSTSHDAYSQQSVDGACEQTHAYDMSRAASAGKAAINYNVLINTSMLWEEGTDRTVSCANTLIHEFGHELGLIDYYDVTYSGINAVGGFDMQSDNVGDWNAYSKYAVGWVCPTVLTSQDIGSGLTVTLSNFEESGDVIVIPTEGTKVNADGTMSPFNEYILLELFTPDGLNAPSAQAYGLTKAGIRIWHVDASMIQIPLKNSEGNEYTVGDFLHSNVYSENGMYNLEVIQRGGVNTFTEFDMLYPYLENSDLFGTGDSFSMNSHGAFFYQGLLDDGSEFPYTIKIKAVTDSEATIEISK